VIDAVRHLSRSELLVTFQMLELQMLRTCANFVLELLRLQVMSQLGAYIRGAMQEVVVRGDCGHGVSPLASRQRIRALLLEGADDDESGVDWIRELLAAPPREAYELLECGEDALAAREDLAPGGEVVWHEAMFKAIGAATAEVYAVLRSAVKASVALVLQPGEVMYQRSTMVLIQGSLSDLGETVSADLGAKRAPSSASDGDDADPSRNAASGPRVLPSQAVQQAHPIISGNDIHVAPSVMVWTPDYFGEAAKQEAVLIRAGPDGATLMVYGTDASSFMRRLESDREAVEADLDALARESSSIRVEPSAAVQL